MRRLLAISLLLLLGFPLVSPLFALTADAEMNLPACCRRNGAHHCRMGAAERDGLAEHSGAKAPAMGGRCPYLPQGLPVAANASFFVLTDAAARGFADLAVDRFAIDRELALRRVLRERSSLQRGPPAFSL